MLPRLTSALVLALVSLLTAMPSTAGSVLAPMKDAARLFELGLDQRDPVLLLAAARLRKAGPPAPEGWTDWTDMLQAARKAAPTDPLIGGIADDIASEGMRGAATGPIHNFRQIVDFDTIELTVTGGEHAEIYVEGDDGTALDILVRDPSGQVVCADTHPSDVAYCIWLPTETVPHQVTVTNLGTSGRYVFLTN